MCYHPLFLFNQFGDLERVMLRRGNHSSAMFWRRVLLPVLERFQRLFELIILVPLVAIEPPAQAVELPLNLLAAEHGQLALHAVTPETHRHGPGWWCSCGPPSPGLRTGGAYVPTGLMASGSRRRQTRSPRPAA
jgi:hypothetical protein